MNRQQAILAAVLAVPVCTAPLRAHHSISMFDISTPIWIQGTVVRFDLVNPHAMMTLEERREDGEVRRWTLEGPGILAIRRSSDPAPDLVQPGDVVEVCGFAPKAEFSSERPSPDTAGYPPLFLHGHVLLLPGGRTVLFGGYGDLGECVRSSSAPIDTWLDFLNSVPRARNLWCGRRSSSMRATDTVQARVEAINRRLAEPCG